MIDRIFYSFFSYIDSWFEWVDKQFIKKKRKKK